MYVPVGTKHYMKNELQTAWEIIKILSVYLIIPLALIAFVAVIINK